ncbi:hypothetical protein SDC9_107376 [bioreactor metagenome]|uniref:Uncharacterized protein n=1 Tax=bioreactor metagenome TaxID=1076179 RepID=A0A645B517_9ZZZZ
MEERHRRARHDAEDHRGDQSEDHHDQRCGGGVDDLRAVDRLTEEHDRDHPQVVDGGHQAEQHADQRQPAPAALEGGGEDGPLAHEAGGQRDAGEAQHEHRHHRGEHRILPAEPGPPGQLGHLGAVVTHHGHHGERRDGGHTVREQVERGGRHRGETTDPVGGLGRTGDGDEDVAGVGDRGVRQQPLDVGLHETDERADQHGEDRCDGQHRLPVPPLRSEGHVQHPQQPTDGGDLGADRHEGGDRGRGAGVDVRHPAVERHDADLEQQADQHHQQAGDQHALGQSALADAGVDHGELEGP